MSRYVLAAALVFCSSISSRAALERYWIVQDAQRQCQIVEVPTHSTQTTIARLGIRVGKNFYGTLQEAEEDMSLLCDKPVKKTDEG
jgi:hypothetical protein